jgi:Domain of unknown function (DUF4340)
VAAEADLMGWRTNLALVALVGGVGGYLYVNQVEPEKPPENGDIGSLPLLPKGAWTARKIWLQYRDDRAPIVLDLDLRNDKFQIVEPVRDVASYAVLKSILDVYATANLLTGYTAEELAADPALLKKTGLDEPLGKIEFRYTSDDKVVLEFGNPGVRDGVMWARCGDAIYRIDPALRSLLDKNPDDFRERLLFTDHSIGKFRKVRFDRRVDGEPQTHLIELRSLDAIRIVEPVSARADPAAFGQYLRSIGSLYIESFLSGAAQPAGGGAPPDYQISVSGDRGSETLDVRVLENGTYLGHLHRRNIVFAIKKRGILDLPNWLPALRQKKVVTISEPDIHRVELDTGAGVNAVLIRSSEGFRIDKPIAIPKTNPTPLAELIHALTHLAAKGFVDKPGADTGLKDGAGYTTVRVSVVPGTGERSISIRLGKSAGEGLVYARREDEDNVLLLSAADVAPMRRPWLEFASLYVPPLSVSAFRVEVHAPGRKEPIVYTNEDFDWRRLEAGKQVAGPPDAEVREFADSLKTLRSKGIVPVSQLDPKARSVRVVLRRNIGAHSGPIYELTMRAHGEHVVLQVKGLQDISYRVGAPFKSLFERWTRD